MNRLSHNPFHSVRRAVVTAAAVVAVAGAGAVPLATQHAVEARTPEITVSGEAYITGSAGSLCNDPGGYQEIVRLNKGDVVEGTIEIVTPVGTQPAYVFIPKVVSIGTSGPRTSFRQPVANSNFLGGCVDASGEVALIEYTIHRAPLSGTVGGNLNGTSVALQ